MANTPYKVLANLNPGLPVYKVQKGGENHVRILHCNMSLPLVTPEDSSDCSPEAVDLDSTSAGDEDPYVGPITRSMKKAQDSILAQANTLMDGYFDEDTGGPITVSFPSVYHFLD